MMPARHGEQECSMSTQQGAYTWMDLLQYQASVHQSDHVSEIGRDDSYHCVVCA